MTTAYGAGPIVVLAEDAPDADWEPWGTALRPAVGEERTSRPQPPTEGALWLHRTGRRAAFSRRDTLAPGYPAAAAACERHGFAPFVRPVGGRMAPYHADTLVIDLAAPDPLARNGIRERFEIMADAIVGGLRALGLDARVGEVPDEYCPGEFSVHAVSDRGARKLAGVAQRVNKWGSVVSAMLVVADPDPLRAVAVDAYAALEQPLDPASVGAVSDDRPDVSWSQVAAAVREELRDRIPVLR
ncbi:lipoate--protein ligase family protein [Nakamurella flava]|uniref:Lipoate--protein ligase family protein n=1 Tax=Nakamurella flava TaxID=2576308 RepID=A0A4U6QIS1_9ACTN|nr:lipoate--protein ligase family protein [Nakamurella flava]TKV60324.1 lipoate--protein ligase family protein [Nakamurella flava]